MTLLRVDGLGVRLDEREVLTGVGFTLGAGRRIGIVGPSGAGKSLLTRAILGLAPRRASVEGAVTFDGTRLDELDDAGWSRVRGSRIGIVFQEPGTALDPSMRIGRQIGVPLGLHRGLSGRARTDAAEAWCERVGLPTRVTRAFPHQLSGGQRQRAALAIALAGEPDLLVADEPTTALDTTVQREVLDLIDSLVVERGLALIVVTHDLAVAARVTDDLLVLVDGRMAESGPTLEVLARPRHSTTRAMVESARRAEIAIAPRVEHAR